MSFGHLGADIDTVGLLFEGGAVKDKRYADKPEAINALKDNIREATAGEIQLDTIDNVLKNWTASRGSHLNEIIFHY